MHRIFHHRLVVADDDIDLNRHVNNLVYLRWMQDIATAHSAAQGWPLERYLSAGAGWFVRSHHIEYMKPAFAGNALRISTWVSEMTARSSTRHYQVSLEDDGAVLARAKTVWVFVDFRSGRPARIADEVRSAFAVVPHDEADLALLATPEEIAA